MKSGPGKILSFALYGEGARPLPGGRLHIEDIQSRSSRYQWEIAPHVHRDLYQCILIVRGPATVQVDEVQRQIPAPAVAILPPGTIHAFSFSNETHGFVLTIGAETLYTGPPDPDGTPAGALFTQPHLLPLAAQSPPVQRLTPLFELLLQEFHRPDSGTSPVCVWLARSALWLIAQELRLRHEIDYAGSSSQLQRFARFQAAIEAHFLEHWSMQRYARALGLTLVQLNRMCRMQRGRSAFDLVQERIALEARRQLADPAVPVIQVAAQLGFRDPAYFCRFFKRRAGLSPGAFRRRQGTPAGEPERPPASRRTNCVTK